MTEIHELTALELAAAIRAGETSPTEVLDHTLERAERLGPQVGAFVTLTPELARDQAVAAEQELASGSGDAAASGRAGGIGYAYGHTPGGPPGNSHGHLLSGRSTNGPLNGSGSLLGVPCPIKDLNMVAGVPVRGGSAALGDVVAPIDDGVVTLLRDAGTLMIGKTNTPEFGLPAYTEPDIMAPAGTPWDLRRSAGGSSGGAAAAVAAGIVPVAHGSDGGGSIRIPASACGLVGLKSTRGRVSPGPYGVAGAGLAVNGALTRDVRDTAAMLDILAHNWPGDLYTLPGPRTTFLDACVRHPGTLRVGVLTTPAVDADATVDPVCVEAATATASLLEELGHEVEVAPVPFPPERWASFEVLWSVLALLAPIPPDSAEADLLVPLTRWLQEKGKAVSGVEYARAVNNAQLTTREVAATWATYDIIVTPTLARPPAMIGELRNDADPAADFAAQTAYTPWTSVWNLTGWPAISLPLHWADVDGVTLPIGVMLGGWHGAEETLLSVASQLEEARPWRERRPPVW